ncbi:MAG: IS66 family transposase [bacterium]
MQEQNQALQQQIVSLQEQIQLLKNGRNSNTSSTPPSQDIGRSNKKSLREPSTRKTGGQTGHEGVTLQMKEKPDKIVEYRPKYCKQCGEELARNEVVLGERKQEVELPPIVPQYVEHQSYSCVCKKCGFVTTNELPERLQANIQYGQQVSAWVAYLSVRQYLSYERIAEFMRDCLNLPISEGTIDNMLKDLTEKAQTVYEEIKVRVSQSSVVGGDESGIKINGKKGWLWTFQTPVLTFLVASMSRGFETISNLFKNGFPVSVYVSDCLPAQLKVRAKLHQICTSHLLRELGNFIDAFKCQWSTKMKQLLKEALELKSQLRPEDYLHPNEKVLLIHSRLDELLHTELSDKHKKVQAFMNRLNKNHNAILTFLYHPKIPSDNNGSERSIRNAKVKMKVSGQFKTFAGAHRFAVLRSVIDTTIKNSQNVLEALCLLSKMPVTC